MENLKLVMRCGVKMVIFERMRLVGELKAKANLKEKEFIEYTRLEEIRKEERVKKQEEQKKQERIKRDLKIKKQELQHKKAREKRIEIERIEKTGKESLCYDLKGNKVESGWSIYNPFLNKGYNEDLTITPEELLKKESERKEELELLKEEEKRIESLSPFQMLMSDRNNLSFDGSDDYLMVSKKKEMLEGIRNQIENCSLSQ